MSSKSLNPNAQEFKPTTQLQLLHPHHFFSNSSQKTVQAQTLPFIVTQPPVTYVQHYPIFHWVEECFYRPFSAGKTPVKNSNGHAEKRQKYPFSDVSRFGERRRNLRRVVTSFPVNEKPKKVWMPKGGVVPPVSPAKANTTVMIRHIPNQLRRDFMLSCLDSCCRNYSLEYDFFYLPMDFSSGDNLGYAFVNFTSSDAAKTFMTVFDGFKWVTLRTDKGPITSKKICRIKWARVQGKDGLLRRFQCSKFICNNLEYLPVLLDPPRNGSNANPAPPVVIGQLHPCPY